MNTKRNLYLSDQREKEQSSTLMFVIGDDTEKVNIGENKCRMYYEYVVWYIGMYKLLYCLVLEHHKDWILSLYIF